MIIKVIFGQRKESYEGQHAPEALDVVDEYTFDENPDWIIEKLKRHEENKDFISVKIIDIDIDGDKVYGALVKTPEIYGEVQE